MFSPRLYLCPLYMPAILSYGDVENRSWRLQEDHRHPLALHVGKRTNVGRTRHLRQAHVGTLPPSRRTSDLPTAASSDGYGSDRPVETVSLIVGSRGTQLPSSGRRIPERILPWARLRGGFIPTTASEQWRRKNRGTIQKIFNLPASSVICGPKAHFDTRDKAYLKKAARIEKRVDDELQKTFGGSKTASRHQGAFDVHTSPRVRWPIMAPDLSTTPPSTPRTWNRTATPKLLPVSWPASPTVIYHNSTKCRYETGNAQNCKCPQWAFAQGRGMKEQTILMKRLTELQEAVVERKVSTAGLLSMNRSV